MRPGVSIGADLTWRMVTSRAAGRYMQLACRLSTLKLHLLSEALFGVARPMLLLALMLNLAATHSERAFSLARTLNLLFRPTIKRRQVTACGLYFEALMRTMGFDRIAREVPAEEVIGHHRLNHVAGIAHLYASNVRLAKYFLDRAISIHASSYMDHRMLGRAFLLEDSHPQASAAFKRSVELFAPSVMAHQNYAGRYDIAGYRPKSWELEHAGELLIYDNLGQLAEDLFLQGRAEESFRLYQQMLNCQDRLARQIAIPRGLVSRLASEYPSFDPALPVRLLPYEWVTQFGHIGLLDSYAKMARLGMYPAANYVVLAPARKVVNEDFLGYWDGHFIMVRDDDLIDELFPYQRCIGANFMAFPGAGDEAEPWTRAAARAQAQWAQKGMGPLLKLSEEDDARGCEARRRLGIPNDAWYVGLHVREGGYYKESDVGMSAHRNARIEDYLPAIAEITSRGGWVIRLGDRTMRRLPALPQVVDYAHSDMKSSRMDLFLFATSRFVIGTTTGLTTACLAFGCPMVLVNCISNDWQLWTDDTDFALKRIYDSRQRRFLSLAETYRRPIQGILINSTVMRRRGYVAVPNSAQEITEAVTYKLDILDKVRSRPDDSHPTLARYRQALAGNPYVFGAARPVVPFLERHPDLLSVEEFEPIA